MNTLFLFIKYLGGAYLVWPGIRIWISTRKTSDAEQITGTSILSSFMSGLLITLADVKAIFFYLVFFSAYIDLTTLSAIQTDILVSVSIAAVAMAKLSYALLAHRARAILNSPGTLKRINIVVGCIIVGTGLYLITKP